MRAAAAASISPEISRERVRHGIFRRPIGHLIVRGQKCDSSARRRMRCSPRENISRARATWIAHREAASISRGATNDAQHTRDTCKNNLDIFVVYRACSEVRSATQPTRDIPSRRRKERRIARITRAIIFARARMQRDNRANNRTNTSRKKCSLFMTVVAQWENCILLLVTVIAEWKNCNHRGRLCSKC